MQCEVCYETVKPVDVTTDVKDGQDGQHSLVVPGCGHNAVCTVCLCSYLTSRITSSDVAAWIPCPHPDCSQPLPPVVLCFPSLLPPSLLLLLLRVFLSKQLSRSTAFIPCSTSLCPFAFFSLSASSPQTVTCPLCEKEQKVQRGKQEELDPAFARMIQDGTLRPCPACSHYTMKEKVGASTRLSGSAPCVSAPPLTELCAVCLRRGVQGICNVIECAKCGVSAAAQRSGSACCPSACLGAAVPC